MSAFILGYSFTLVKNFQILWDHDTNPLFSCFFIHRRKSELNLILQTVTIIANILVNSQSFSYPNAAGLGHKRTGHKKIGYMWSVK